MMTTVEYRKAEIDAGQATRAAIGLIVLQNDETVEYDVRNILPSDGVRLYISRIPVAPAVTEKTLVGMADDLKVSAGLLPLHLRFSAIGYACTSASLVIGEDRVCELINSAAPNVLVSNPFSALKSGLATLGVRRIGLICPYSRQISHRFCAVMEENGFDVVRTCVFDESDDRIVARISPWAVREAIVDVGSDPSCEVAIALCTNLRVCDLVTDIEAAIGKPVLCSNQLLAWHLMRLAGIEDRREGFGRLFDHQLR